MSDLYLREEREGACVYVFSWQGYVSDLYLREKEGACVYVFCNHSLLW